ncbi:hypothetical protein V8C42DRAFT_332470 [Trichoderma barbatum]
MTSSSMSVVVVLLLLSYYSATALPQYTGHLAICRAQPTGDQIRDFKEKRQTHRLLGCEKRGPCTEWRWTC